MGTTAPVPNAWCVMLGRPGTDPLTFVGPFATIEEANAHAAQHLQENPDLPALADILLNPANC